MPARHMDTCDPKKSPCLNGVSETLDSLHRSLSTLVHPLVDALEMEGKAEADADDEKLATDRGPQTGTVKGQNQRGTVSE